MQEGQNKTSRIFFRRGGGQNKIQKTSTLIMILISHGTSICRIYVNTYLNLAFLHRMVSQDCIKQTDNHRRANKCISLRRDISLETYRTMSKLPPTRNLGQSCSIYQYIIVTFYQSNLSLFELLVLLIFQCQIFSFKKCSHDSFRHC